jgi:flagellar hook-length control protein FliK
LKEWIVVMDIGFYIPSAGEPAALTSSSVPVDHGQLAQDPRPETFFALIKDIAQRLPDRESASDNQVSISPAGAMSALTSLSVLTGVSQFVRLAQGEVSFVLPKGIDQSLSDEETIPPSESDAPTESIPSSDAGAQSSLALVGGLALATDSPRQDLPEGISAEGGHAEAAQNRATIDAALAKPAGLPDYQVLQSLADAEMPRKALTNELKHTDLRTMNELPVRNGGGTPVDPAPAPLEHAPDDSTHFSTPLPGSLGSDPGRSSVVERQGARNILASAYGNGSVQSPDRLSTGVQPLTMLQALETEETALLEPLAASVTGVDSGREQDPQESLTRDNQPLFFSGQSVLARQAQAQPQGTSGSVATTTGDRLTLAQAFLGENHSAATTSASGKAQAVHVELPPHDSGPLSVRISMTDQTVHTQFTTDRNDLGALLLTRQDQLQHTLTKSGLELGQFQVHIDQRSQQDAAPDRQPRRNGDAPEHQPGSQNHNQDARDRDPHGYRPRSALSLFA